jgi:hypothetical protein
MLFRQACSAILLCRFVVVLLFYEGASPFPQSSGGAGAVKWHFWLFGNTGARGLLNGIFGFSAIPEHGNAYTRLCIYIHYGSLHNTTYITSMNSYSQQSQLLWNAVNEMYGRFPSTPAPRPYRCDCCMIE